MKEGQRKISGLEKTALRVTEWVGSTSSLIVHTVVFLASFLLVAFGIPLEEVLLVLTTAVSLEAIYLAVFIQMTVNRNTQSLEEVEEDIDEIQEDVDEIQKDVDDIQEDVDEIEKDVDQIEKDIDEIQEDVDEMEKDDDQQLVHGQQTQDVLIRIQGELGKLMKEIEAIKQERK